MRSPHPQPMAAGPADRAAEGTGGSEGKGILTEEEFAAQKAQILGG